MKSQKTTKTTTAAVRSSISPEIQKTYKQHIKTYEKQINTYKKRIKTYKTPINNI